MGLNNHIFDFHTEVSKGLVPKHSLIHKFGHNEDIDTTTDPETVWSAGGTYVFSSVDTGLKVVSNDVDDNGTGTTGAISITVQGLDANYDLISESIELNGQTAVTSENRFIRVYRAFVDRAGSSQTNEGTITINNQDDSLTLAEIPALHGQTQMCVYTIPRNYKGYITSFSGSMAKAVPDTTAILAMSFIESGVKKIQQKISVSTSGSTSFIKHFQCPLPVNEKTDIIVDVSEVSQNNTAVFSNFAILLVDQSEKYK